MLRPANLLWTALAIGLALAALQLDGSGTARVARAPDLLGTLLVIAACAPVATRRRIPLGSAAAAMLFAGVAMALGYMAIVPILVGLLLCGRAAIYSAQRVTIPLAIYAGAVVATAVTITDDESPVPLRIVLGAAIGATAVLIGDVIRSERERTREKEELARRIAELRDRDVEHAVVEERLRIAREVHDITGHHLSAISLQAAGAGRNTSDPVAGETLGRIHQLATEALGQTRRALGVLRESGPASRDPIPRLEDLEQLLLLARDAGLEVELLREGVEARLPEQIEACAYRVVQESLTNVVRHSGAESVRVRVILEDEGLLVEITDDGTGGSEQPGGGIRGMQERVAIVGGSFRAGPGEQGWKVRVSLPLDAEPGTTDLSGSGADVDQASKPAPEQGPVGGPDRANTNPVSGAREAAR